VNRCRAEANEGMGRSHGDPGAAGAWETAAPSSACSGRLLLAAHQSLVAPLQLLIDERNHPAKEEGAQLVLTPLGAGVGKEDETPVLAIDKIPKDADPAPLQM
jgi:hypothetical protein